MNNLLFFPEPYPDEDFRSLVYRYHIKSGNTHFSWTKGELFGINTNSLGVIPRNLSYFFDKIPAEYSITMNDMLFHTWFPLLKSFLPKERLSEIEEDIMYGKGRQKAYSGMLNNQRRLPFISKKIKYCPLCIEIDYQEYGEAYVHLQHQLTFIDFCPEHYIKLTDKCPECGGYFSNPKKLSLTVKPCCNNIDYEKVRKSRITEFKIRLLTEIIYFKNHTSNISCETLYMKLLTLIGNAGYIYIREGSIDKTRLIDDLCKQYQEDCPLLVNTIKNAFSSVANRNKLFNKNNMSVSLWVYFLLILYLAGSIKKFLDNQDIYSIPLPFGTGPWPCYNPICPSFKIRSLITRCKQSYNRNGFKAEFLCPICGFEYETYRVKPGEINISNRYNIKNYGHLWERKVLELYNSGHKTKEIVQSLNTTRHYVQTCLNKLKNQHVRQGENKVEEFFCLNNEIIKESEQDKALKNILLGKSEAASTSTKINETRINCRKKIMDLIKEDRNLKRMEVRQRARNEYKWLKDNDQLWLNEILPTFSIDYSSIDDDLEVKIRNAAKSVYAANPPRPIKMHTILNVMEKKDKNHVRLHMERLPKAMAEIKMHIETIQEYRIRKVPSLMSQIKSRGRRSKVTLKCLLAFRSSYRDCDEETMKRIEKVLEDLQKDN